MRGAWARSEQNADFFNYSLRPCIQLFLISNDSMNTLQLSREDTMSTFLILTGGFVILIGVMIWAIKSAKAGRSAAARKRGAGLLLMSSMMFGIGSMFDEPPPKAEEARNNTLEKKSESSGPVDETE